MKISHIEIGLHSDGPGPHPEDKNHYSAEGIHDGGKFYYRAKGVTLEVTKSELETVVSNPRLYYFSTALLLDVKLEQARLA